MLCIISFYGSLFTQSCCVLLSYCVMWFHVQVCLSVCALIRISIMNYLLYKLMNSFINVYTRMCQQ